MQQGGAGWALGQEQVQGGDTRTGEVKVARAPEEMTLVWGDPEMANELEMASQARGVERD